MLGGVDSGRYLVQTSAKYGGRSGTVARHKPPSAPARQESMPPRLISNAGEEWQASSWCVARQASGTLLRAAVALTAVELAKCSTGGSVCTTLWVPIDGGWSTGGSGSSEQTQSWARGNWQVVFTDTVVALMYFNLWTCSKFVPFSCLGWGSRCGCWDACRSAGPFNSGDMHRRWC